MRITSPGEAEAVERTLRQRPPRTGGEPGGRGRPGAAELALFVWGIITGLVAYGVIGLKVYLIFYYGWTRVRNEGLSVVERNRLGWTHWVISNGDRIHVPEYLEDIVITGTWFVIMVLTGPIVWLVFRRCGRQA